MSDSQKERAVHNTMENGFLFCGSLFLVLPLLLPFGYDLIQLLLLFLENQTKHNPIIKKTFSLRADV